MQSRKKGPDSRHCYLQMSSPPADPSHAQCEGVRGQILVAKQLRIAGA